MIRTFLKPLSFLPALCLMYMIFTFSAQDGNTSAQLSYKVSYKMVEVGGKVLGADFQPWEIESLANRFHGVVRKLAHMTEYFALAIAVSFPLYVYGLHGILLMLAAGFICVAFACGDEYHQSFVAGRAPSTRDVLIDSFGVFWGIILVRIIGWTGRKTIFRPLKKKKHGTDIPEQPYYQQPAPGNAYQSGPYRQPGYAHQTGPYQQPAPGSGNAYQAGPYPQGASGNTYQAGPYAQGTPGNTYQAGPYAQSTPGNAYQTGPYAQGSPGNIYQTGPYAQPAPGSAHQAASRRQAGPAPSGQNGAYQQSGPYRPPYPNNSYQSPYQGASGGQYRPGYQGPAYQPPYYPQEEEEHHVSDRLSEDMSLKKLMHDLKDQKKDPPRDSIKIPPLRPKAGKSRNEDPVELDEIDLDHLDE